MLFSGVGNAQSQFDNSVHEYTNTNYTICGLNHLWTKEELVELYKKGLHNLALEVPEYADELAYMADVIAWENSALTITGYHEQTPNLTTQNFNLTGYWFRDDWEDDREFPTFEFFRPQSGTNRSDVLRVVNGEILQSLTFSMNYFMLENQSGYCDPFRDHLFSGGMTEEILYEDFAEYFSDALVTFRMSNGWFYARPAKNSLVNDGVFNSDETDITINQNPNINWQNYIIGTHGMEVVYPEGYEGPEIPGAYEQIKEETYAPDFQYTYNNLNLWASDHEQDLPIFEPDLEGYTDDGYRVEWTVWECRGGEWYPDTASCNGGQTELLKLETLGLNESFTFDVPQLGEYRLQAEYRVSQCYRYGSYPETPDHCFTSSPSVEPNLSMYGWHRRAVIIDMDGGAGGGDTLEMECGYGGFNCDPNTADSNMLPCFTRDFPYINVNNCVKNVFSLFDILTFGRQSIFGFSTNTLECKAIPRVGHWLNLENRYICPQFPGHVRDLVTPFITLTLGMFMVVFISRISRETYN